MDFTGKQVNITGLAKEKKKLKLITSLEVDSADLPRFFQEQMGNLPEKVSEIRVSGQLESTFHKIFVVPDLKKKMLSSTVEAEVVKAMGGEYQFKSKNLGEIPGPGTKINRKMFAVGMKRSSLEELFEAFAESKIKPSLYTTYPTAIQILLEKMEVPTDKPLAFIHVDYPVCRIVVFKGEEIRLTRELPMNSTSGEQGSSDLAKDIYRTLLFYNDSYPEERAQRLMFAGSAATHEIENSLKQKTGAEVIPFDLNNLFEVDPNENRIHPGCLALASADIGRVVFEFVPFSVQEKRRVKRVVVICSSVMAGVILVFLLIISRLSFDLGDMDAFQGGIKGEIKMKEDRLKEMSLEFVSQSIESSQPPWSEILLELAAVVPPGVALKTFTLKNAKKVWRGDVSGVADGSDEINSLLKVEETESNFKKSPLFDGVKLMERELRGAQVEFRIIYQLNI